MKRLQVFANSPFYSFFSERDVAMKIACFYITFILLLVANAMASEELWDRKSPAEWTAKDCARILESSPWVRRDASVLPMLPLQGQSKEAVESSGGEGRGKRSPVDSGERYAGRPNMLYLRWHSAHIVRQAIVRGLQLRGAIQEAQAQQFLDSPAMQKSLVLSVSADTPRPLLSLTRGMEESIRSNSYLEKKNKQRVSVEKVVPMDPQKGAVDLLLVFPRETDGKPTLSLEDEEVEVVFVVGEKRIRQRFRLDKMTVAGKLDL
jgi:hypothetical protein